MKKFILLFVLLSLGQMLAQEKKDDWKIKLKIGNELRLPILKKGTSYSLQPTQYNVVLSLPHNTDMYSFLDGFPLHYAIEFKINRTWSFEFQHSIHYDHVVFKESVRYNSNNTTVSPSINQFYSDYKFSFFKYFKIDEQQQFNVNLGYSFNGYGSFYWVYQHHFLTTFGNNYTTWHVEANYQYKYLSLGVGGYLLDQPDFTVFVGSFKEEYNNFILYFNLDFDILKF